MDGSAHYTGRAVDVFYRPVNATNRRAGWATAQWIVANAERLEIATVIYDGRIWTARRSGQGWREYTPPNGSTANPTLMHRDHVHLDVADHLRRDLGDQVRLQRQVQHVAARR